MVILQVSYCQILFNMCELLIYEFWFLIIVLGMDFIFGVDSIWFIKQLNSIWLFYKFYVIIVLEGMF